MGKKEWDWWASAPEWAQWHTWDFKGKTWWSTEPTISEDGLVWEVEPFFLQSTGNFEMPHHEWYDKTPCPVEIDPATTLRKRLTEAKYKEQQIKSDERLLRMIERRQARNKLGA